MYTEIVYLISALLGFLIIFLISNHYKSNRYANIYLIGILALEFYKKYNRDNFFHNSKSNSKNQKFFSSAKN